MKLTKSKNARTNNTGTQKSPSAFSPRQQHNLRGRKWRSKWHPSRGFILASIALVCIIVYKGAERIPETFSFVVVHTSKRDVVGHVTHVRDGDTIEVGGIPIRFSSLDCAESDTMAGQRATAKMRSLDSSQTLTCHLNGRSSYDRKIGSCKLRDGRDLAEIMIRKNYCKRHW